MSIEPTDLKAVLRELLSQPIQLTPAEIREQEYIQHLRETTGNAAWRERVAQQNRPIPPSTRVQNLQKLRQQLREALDL